MKQFSIRQYVALLTLIPLLMLASGLEIYFLLDRSDELNEELSQRGKLIARQLASSSEYGVFSNNQTFLRAMVQGVLQQPDVQGAVVMSATLDNLVSAGSFSRHTDPKLTLPEQAADAGGEQANLERINTVKALVSMSTPVYGNETSLWIYQPIIPMQVKLDEFGKNPELKPAGAVIIEMNREHTEKRKARAALVTIGATGLFLMAVYYLVYRASRRIIYPISRLSDAVRAIGDGHLETRAAVTVQVTELETLASGINDMAAKLQQENVMLHQRMEDAVRIAAVAFESHEGMMIVDASGAIIRVNKAFSRITGYPEKDVLGQTPHVISSGHHDREFFEAMWDSINANGLWQGEIWNRRKSGEVYPVWTNITAIERDGGEVAYYVATYTDITSRKAAENEIKHMAFNDQLTKLPNRRKLIDILNKSMAISKRSRRFGALMFIDLDNFKPLNDQYGHGVGDMLLIEVAERLVGCVREVDTVARFGGDEFVVMLSELDEDLATSVSQAGLVAEKIRVVLSKPYTLPVKKDDGEFGTVEHHCTSSIGVQMFVGTEVNAEDVLKQADLAMYQAKRSGRNLSRFYA